MRGVKRMHSNYKIQLDESERKLRDLVLQTSKYLTAKNSAKRVVPRFAGGWVRDKLLGLDSNDIDIALDKMTGYDFAQYLHEYSTTSSDNWKDDAGLRSIGKVKANPDRSKHLETATTQLFGLDVDFVNLRSETYSEESRVPQMEFGTPEQDAYRRDATMNALFYNLESAEVEDYTKKGLDDLENRVMRTPLPPLQTFKDDPLRVIRLIRFATKYGCSIEHCALEGMRNDAVQDALRKKVSRERIGVELEKMLKGPDPFASLHLLSSLGLIPAVYDVEMGFPEHLQKALTAFKLSQQNQSICSIVDLDDKAVSFLCWLCCSLVPWKDQTVFVRKKETPLPAQIVRESLKMSSAVADVVQKSFSNTNNPLMGTSETLSRTQLGLYIRSLGQNWAIVILTQLICHVTEHNLDDFEGRAQPFVDLSNTIVKEDLKDAWAIKPLVDGKWLQTEGIVKPGPGMKLVLEEVIQWQLENPDKGVDQCRAFFKGRST